MGGDKSDTALRIPSTGRDRRRWRVVNHLLGAGPAAEMEQPVPSTNQRARLGVAVAYPRHTRGTRGSGRLVNWPLRACRAEIYPVFIKKGPVYAQALREVNIKDRHMSGVYKGG